MMNNCNHKLRRCPHCDTVYCKKCGKEWGNVKWYHCQTTTATPWSVFEPVITYGSNTSGTISVTRCNHN